MRTHKKKKDQLSLAQYGDKLLRTGPILTAPGGWGLRNPEPKGPGQRSIPFSQSSRAVAGRKLGGIMISANDTVTAFFPASTGPKTIRRARIPVRLPRGLLRRRSV